MRSTRFQKQNPHMDYPPDEQGWIERKTWEIQQAGWPLRAARAEAVNEFRRIKDRPKARLILFTRSRSCSKNAAMTETAVERLDRGRFMLHGALFSWWTNNKLVLTLYSETFGSEELQLESDTCPASAARQLARELVVDALGP